MAEHSGKSLDILNGSEKKNANLQQYAWNSSDAQLWKFVKAVPEMSATGQNIWMGRSETYAEGQISSDAFHDLSYNITS